MYLLSLTVEATQTLLKVKELAYRALVHVPLLPHETRKKSGCFNSVSNPRKVAIIMI